MTSSRESSWSTSARGRAISLTGDPSSLSEQRFLYFGVAWLLHCAFVVYVTYLVFSILLTVNNYFKQLVYDFKKFEFFYNTLERFKNACSNFSVNGQYPGRHLVRQLRMSLQTVWDIFPQIENEAKGERWALKQTIGCFLIKLFSSPLAQASWA